MIFRILPFLLLSLPACAAAQEGKESVTIPDSKVKFDLVPLPGGTLKPFSIGACEVTWEEYKLYYKTHRRNRLDGVTHPTQPDVIDPTEPFQNGEPQGPRHPAVSVGWFGAVGYCQWLTKKTGHKYRLPTEAEWEYAAGAMPGAPEEFAWFEANSGGNTHEVGTKRPNAFGLYDMLGNVWENCLEPHAPPVGVPSVRGGGYNTPRKDLDVARRQDVPDAWAERDPKRPLRLWWLTDGNFVGFRVVRVGDVDEAAAKKVEVKDVRIVKAGATPSFFDRVSGEIVNTGDAALDEVEVTVFFLDEGKPIKVDPKEKPCFSIVYPVLSSSGHGAGVRKPLGKGESRKFEVEVPHPFDEIDRLDLNKVGAQVTYVRVSK